ncbi:hypothetical protein J7413_06800 [Shimia sp. R10_1]|uniref:mitofilin family membrane protein n=1 Tax=Shimia sp. R10_1 TaxID=2821095 RepID=UPI001AD9CEAB|nr:hypothetical protein [Shimia sp. R10_1]
MGTTDKSDKPNKDQVDATEAEQVIEDAEIVEEHATEQVAEASDEDPVTIEEPVEAPEPETAVDPEPTEDAPADDESDTEANGAEDGVDTPGEIAPSVDAVETLPAPDTTQEPQKRGGFVPMVLGGAVAAAIGFGGAVYFGDQLGLGGDTKAAIAELTAQLEAQSATLAELDGEIGASGDAAGAAQSAAQAAAGELETLRAALESQTNELGTLAEAVATFEARLTDIEKRPLNEGLGAAAIAAYEREVKDLKELVAAQKAEAAELKDRADLSAKTALARSSVARIVAALDSGASYSGALVDLRSATGQEVAPVLAQFADEGLVTLAALIESYPEAARAALAKARADKVDEGQGNRLGNFFKTQFGARSVEAREGSDTDAILSRAEAALKAGDLTAALGEIATLAEGPKSVMADWVAQAQTRADATQAAEDLAQTLNSN